MPFVDYGVTLWGTVATCMILGAIEILSSVVVWRVKKCWSRLLLFVSIASSVILWGFISWISWWLQGPLVFPIMLLVFQLAWDWLVRPHWQKMWTPSA